MTALKRAVRYVTGPARKALAAAGTGLGAVLAAGLVHGTALVVVVFLVAVIGVPAAVHQTSNTDT